MIKLFSVPAFLILMLTGVAFSQPADKSEAQKIKMTLEAEKNIWGKNSPSMVRITIENPSESAVTFTSSVLLMLVAKTPDGRIDRDSFSAPLSLTKAYAEKTDVCQNDLTAERVVNGSILGPGSIVLAKGEVRELSFDLAKLCWNRLISSVYPNQNLFPLVKAGKYQLSFGKSNKVEIEVK
jgi:hypothetical protein